VKTFEIIARVVFVVVIMLAVVTTVTSYLSEASAVTPKCAGQKFVGGYSIGVGVYLYGYAASALAVASAGCATLGKGERLRKLFEVHTMPVKLLFGSIEAPFGAIVAYSGLFAPALGLAYIAGVSLARYYAVVFHCLTTNALLIAL
jgi:hypothetical protein